MIIFDEDRNEIFKISKNLNVDIKKIKQGKIDEMFLKSKDPIIINNEDLEKKGIVPTKKDTISSIVFPMYFKGKLIGVMNLNRKSTEFTSEELEILNRSKIYIMPAIYNVVLLEAVNRERENFKKYLHIFELIVYMYLNTNTVMEFITETINKIRRQYGTKIEIVSAEGPGENTIKIKNLYYKVNIDYDKNDEDIISKLKDFMMKMIVIKHSEELNKVLSEYSEITKETLLMNFMSWDLIQEINSAITGINLVTFFFESQNPEISSELKKSVNRIKEAISRYKANFYNNEAIELVHINNILNEIENKIKFLNPDVVFKKDLLLDAQIYGSKKIIFNALMNVILAILKYTANKYFEISLKKEENYYYLRITTNIKSIELNNKELKKAINISSVMFNNYHIEFIEKSDETNTSFIIQIPAK